MDKKDDNLQGVDLPNIQLVEDEVEKEVVIIEPEESDDEDSIILLDEDGGEEVIVQGENGYTLKEKEQQSRDEDLEEIEKLTENEELVIQPKNVTIRHKIESDVIDESIKDLLKNDPSKDAVVSLPSSALSNSLVKLRDYITYVNSDPNTDKIDEVIDHIGKLLLNTDKTGVEKTIFGNPDAKFEQGVYYPEKDELLSIRSVELGGNTSVIKGDSAILKVAKALGVGDVVQVPLPHSGFWVTLAPPTEKDLVKFYNTYTRDKITLGRTSYGLTHLNMSAKINMELVKFIKKHIISITFEDIAKTDVEDKILLNDLPILIWGFARTIYPEGFFYRRLCDNIGKPDEHGKYPDMCKHIEEVTLSLDKMLFIDNTKLNDTQKSIFSNVKAKSIKMSDYKNYIAQASYLLPSSFKYKNTEIFLRQPTIKDHIEDGMDWIDGIVREYDLTLATGNYTKEEKDETMFYYVESSKIRNWSHYVEKIVIHPTKPNAKEQEILDRPTIREALSRFGTNKDFYGKFVEAVSLYRNESVIGTVGIPEYTCPVCQHENKNHGEPSVTSVIPLDVTNLFFLMFITKFQMVIMETTTD